MRKKRLIRLAAIIFCLYLIATTSRAIADLWGAGEKLTRRQERVAELQKEQEELKKRKARAESEGYIERIAREQLGMSKPGEEVIIIPRELLAEKTPPATPDAVPNWRKWLKLLIQK